MPKRYPEEFRRKVLDLVATGRPIAQIAADLNIGDQTICGWRKQEHIDTAQLPGLNRAELAQLSAANRRIRELETEVAVGPSGPGWPRRSFDRRLLRQRDDQIPLGQNANRTTHSQTGSLRPRHAHTDRVRTATPIRPTHGLKPSMAAPPNAGHIKESNKLGAVPVDT